MVPGDVIGCDRVKCSPARRERTQVRAARGKGFAHQTRAESGGLIRGHTLQVPLIENEQVVCNTSFFRHDKRTIKFSSICISFILRCNARPVWEEDDTTQSLQDIKRFLANGGKVAGDQDCAASLEKTLEPSAFPDRGRVEIPKHAKVAHNHNKSPGRVGIVVHGVTQRREMQFM